MRKTAFVIVCMVLASRLCAAELSIRTTCGRSVFRRGEAFDVVVQLQKHAEAKPTVIEFFLNEESASVRIGRDTFTPVPGRRTILTYSFDAYYFRAASYTLAAHVLLGDSQLNAGIPLEIMPLHRLTDYPIIHRGIPRWLQQSGNIAEDSALLGFNTIMTSLCGSWHRNATAKGLTEPEKAVEEMLRHGINFVKHPVVPEFGRAYATAARHASWFDSEAIDESGQLIEYHAQVCRRFPNFIGINAIDEPHIPWSDPYMKSAFKRFTGLDAPEQYDMTDIGKYVAYLRFREEMIDDLYSQMRAQVRRVHPSVKLAVQASAGMFALQEHHPPVGSTFDIHSIHIFDHWPSSSNWPAFAVNLGRANRAASRDRPLWALTGCYGIMPDQWRTVWALAMCEKLEGHGYSLNAEELHPDRPWTEFSLAEIARINRILQQYGNFFLQLEKPVEPLALWYSAAQASRRPDGLYEQEVIGAFLALKRAHFPVTVVADEDIRAGLLAEHKVLMIVGVNHVPDDIRESIKSFMSKGGRLVADRTSMAFNAAVRMDADFSEFAASMAEAARAWNENRTADAMRLRRCSVAEVTIRRQLSEVKSTLIPLVERTAYADSPDVFITVQQHGRARYVFLANVASVHRYPNEAERWATMRESVPLTTTVTIPGARGQVAYDLFTGRRLQLDGGSVTLRLPPGGLQVLCLLPFGEPGVPELLLARDCNWPGTIYFGTVPVARDGGIVPAHVTLKRPDGSVALEQYDTLKMAGSRWSYQMTVNEPAGVWLLTVRNLLTGAQRSLRMQAGGLRSGPRSMIIRRGPATAHDFHAYAPFVKKSPLVVSSGAESDRYAELLGLDLATEVGHVDSVIRRSASVSETLVHYPESGVWPSSRRLPSSVKIGRDLILLGSPENNPLIQEINRSGILRVPISRETIGHGQAMISYAWSPFDLGHDVVIIAAYDDEGLRAGYERFLTLAELRQADLLPRDVHLAPEIRKVSQRSVSASPPPQTIIPAAHLKVEDGILKLSAGGDIVAAGTMDSRLLVLDSRGKLLWTRELDYRVLGVSVSKCGDHVAAAAFPRTYLFNRDGGMLLLTSIEEPSRHDVEALAVTQEPLMLFAGTWTGQVIARDAAGALKWQAGTEKHTSHFLADLKRPVPDSIGPIRGIAPLRNGTVAVGGMQSLVIFDSSGREIARTGIDRLQDVKPAGRNVFAASFKKKLLMLNAWGELLWERSTPDFVMAIDASSDGRRVAAAYFSGRVQILDGRGRLIHNAQLPFQSTLTGVAFVDDATAVWLSTWDGQLVKWIFE